MEVFKIIYSALGGLGIFFYGMKAMSDSLQLIAGDVIKNVINSLTKNRVFAVLVGITVTMIVQSSSITTVMVVGLVNAGLMKLTQAIGIVFGANIGTTITGWIISIKVGKYGLLLIGLGIFPALFGKSNKAKQIGRVLFGIGMIFFGLKIMSDAFKPLRSMPEFLDAIAYFSGQHYGAYLANIIVGCILTMIVQSSSAMLGITIALASTGVLTFHTAAALVLGENIGTTITALLASVGGNVNAKRAARAHAIFNMLGVFAMLAIFPYYIQFIDSLVPGDPNLIGAEGDKPNIAVHIATGHTIFNVVATIIFLPFLNVLARFVTRITPDKALKEKHHLVVLGNPSDMVPATALVQATIENKKFSEILDRMFKLTREYLFTKGMDTRENFSKIKDYEQITDNIQKEITVFICSLMENELSEEQSKDAQAIVRIADEIESIADYLDLLATYHDRFKKEGPLDGEAYATLRQFYDDIYDYYQVISKGLHEPDVFDKTVIERKSEELRMEAEDIRERHVQRVSKGKYKALTALTYSDMVVALRKIRSHSLNIAQAISK